MWSSESLFAIESISENHWILTQTVSYATSVTAQYYNALPYYNIVQLWDSKKTFKNLLTDLFWEPQLVK